MALRVVLLALGSVVVGCGGAEMGPEVPESSSAPAAEGPPRGGGPASPQTAAGDEEAGTALTITSLSVDGLQVEDLRCTMREGGLLAAAELVAGLAAQRDALDACAPAGAAPRVTWSFGGGAVTAVEAKGSGSDAVDACVAGVFKQVRPSLSGRCSAVVHVGGTRRAPGTQGEST